MFQFDVLTVAELKALCSELGVVVGNSAPKTEYVAGLEKYFQDKNVGEALMALKRDNLQKVARRLGLTASGTKRELTDTILAKVNPQVTDPIVAQSDPVVSDPKIEETRKGLPWWAWALIVAGIILIAVLAFRPRQAAPAVDLTPLQTSIGEVSTKVDNLGQEITGLSDRVTALEQVPAEVETEAEAEAPADTDPVVETVSDNIDSGVLDGYVPISSESGYGVFDLVSAADHFEPMWPEGTNQTSVGYSTPEEFPDGRSFATRVPTTEDEILVFVAQCVEIYGGEKICADEGGALVGAVIGAADQRIKLWDAELKTLTIPGKEPSWRAFVFELAQLISSNKGGASVEILGALAQ